MNKRTQQETPAKGPHGPQPPTQHAGACRRRRDNRPFWGGKAGVIHPEWARGAKTSRSGSTGESKKETKGTKQSRKEVTEEDSASAGALAIQTPCGSKRRGVRLQSSEIGARGLREHRLRFARMPCGWSIRFRAQISHRRRVWPNSGLVEPHNLGGGHGDAGAGFGEGFWEALFGNPGIPVMAWQAPAAHLNA